jgi:flagellar biosynthesis chaperone FliJ
LKTRYTSLVGVKKNIMQKRERELQALNLKLKNARLALENSKDDINNIQTPHEGNMSAFLASRTLLDTQRSLISHNEAWVNYTQQEVQEAKKNLQEATTEFEKFKYLETTEIKKQIQQLKIKEAKDLDEVALMTYNKKELGAKN